MTLQFPDEYLGEAAQILLVLRDKSPADTEYYLSIDNSKNPCCVDYTSAHHIYAELVVKFGASCVCEEQKIPTLYIFESKTLDFENISKTIKSTSELTTNPTYVFVDQVYQAHASQLMELLDERYSLVLFEPESNNQELRIFNNYYASKIFEPAEKTNLVYIGSSKSYLIPVLSLLQAKLNFENFYTI